MLYKVTPMLPSPASKAKKPNAEAPARKRRATTIFDAEGNEVLITLMCLKCKTMKPLAQFGLRKMADGAIRNQPWCRPCRSGAGAKPKKDSASEVKTPALSAVPNRAPTMPLEVSVEAPTSLLLAAEVLPALCLHSSTADGVETVRMVPVMPSPLRSDAENLFDDPVEETQPLGTLLTAQVPVSGHEP